MASGASVKVLCLHGNGTSSDILKFQLVHLVRAFERRNTTATTPFELVFVNGLEACAPAPGIDLFFPNQTYYRYCSRKEGANGGYAGLPAAFEYLQDLDAKKGPFHAIIGFSQGANLATMVAAEAQQGSVFKELKCTVVMCGSASGWQDQLSELFAAPVPTPSFHVIGEKDDYREKSEVLVKLYANPTVVYHPEQHRPLPGKKAQAVEIVDKIIAFVGQHTAV